MKLGIFLQQHTFLRIATIYKARQIVPGQRGLILPLLSDLLLNEERQHPFLLSAGTLLSFPFTGEEYSKHTFQIPTAVSSFSSETLSSAIGDSTIRGKAADGKGSSSDPYSSEASRRSTR